MEKHGAIFLIVYAIIRLLQTLYNENYHRGGLIDQIPRNRIISGGKSRPPENKLQIRINL